MLATSDIAAPRYNNSAASGTELSAATIQRQCFPGKFTGRLVMSLQSLSRALFHFERHRLIGAVALTLLRSSLITCLRRSSPID